MSAKKVWLLSNSKSGDVLFSYRKSDVAVLMTARRFFIELWFRSGGKTAEFEIIGDGGSSGRQVLEINPLFLARCAYPALANREYSEFVEKLATSLASGGSSSVKVRPLNGFSVLESDVSLSLYGPDFSGPVKASESELAGKGNLLGITREELETARSSADSLWFINAYKSFQATEYLK